MKRTSRILATLICTILVLCVFATIASAANITYPTYNSPSVATTLWITDFENGKTENGFGVSGDFSLSILDDGENKYANITNWVDGSMVESTTRHYGSMHAAYGTISNNSYVIYSYDFMADKYTNGTDLISIEAYNALTDEQKSTYSPSYTTTFYYAEMPNIGYFQSLWVKNINGVWYIASTAANQLNLTEAAPLPTEAGVWTNVSMVLKTDIKVRYTENSVENIVTYSTYKAIADKSAHTDVTVIVNSDLAIYVNGEYAFDYSSFDYVNREFTYEKFQLDSEGNTNGGKFKYMQMQAGNKAGALVTTPMSMCYDNLGCVIYPEEYTGDLATAFAGRSSLNATTDAVFNQNYNKTNTVSAKITKNDGTVYGYYSVEQAYNALTNGDTLEIVKNTNAKFIPKNSQITTSITIIPNGYNFYVTGGYGILDNGDGSYTYKPVSSGYTVNGFIYESESEALAALDDKTELQLYSPLSTPINTDKPISVYTNGFDVTINYTPVSNIYSHIKLFDESGALVNESTFNSSSEIMSYFAQLKDGYSVKFMGDTVIDTPITFSKPINYNIDFNGYDYVTASVSGAHSFKISNGATLNVKSSRPGTEIYNVNNENSNVSIFAMVSSGVANLNVDGKNLKVFARMLIYTLSSNGTINIDGGSYYQTSSSATLINTATTHTINIKNANLISDSGTIFRATNTLAVINVDNSIIYSGGFIISTYSSFVAGAKLNFRNSTICSRFRETGSKDIILANITLMHGTKFTASASVSPFMESGAVLAKTDIANSFDFLIPTIVCNEDGTIDTNTIGYTGYPMLYNAKCVVLTSGYKTVTWKNGDESITEYWANGVTPVCPYEMPASTDIYKYEATIVSEENNTVVYEILPKANFKMLMNLTLNSDFIYNLYIPKALVDSGYILSQKVNGASKSFANKVVTINATEYYVLEIAIVPSLADRNQTVTLEILSPDAKTFEENFTLSIPDYAKRILNGNYSNKTYNLMNSTLAYIKATTDYFDTGIGTIGAVTNADKVDGTPLITPDSEVLAVIKGATLSLDSTFKFSFYFTDTASGKVTFTYLVNGTKKDHVVTATPNGAYQASLRAKDILSGVTVTVNGKTMTYGIENYIYSVNSDSFNLIYPEISAEKHEQLKTLVYNLYAYATAAKKYVSETSLAVLTVNGKVLDNYVIVANTEAEKNAAAYIQNALNNTTGVLLPVVTEANGPAFRFTKLDLPSAFYDYVAFVDGDDIILSSYLPSFIDAATMRFATECIATLYGENNWNDGDYITAYAADTVYYSDFGAVGDGKTNDSIALHETHAYANLRGYLVRADKGATYYLEKFYYKKGSTEQSSIIISTNVDWGDANFILDDTYLASADAEKGLSSISFIKVLSDYTKTSANNALIETLFPGKTIDRDTITTVEGWNFGFPALLCVVNGNHYNYKRTSGSGQTAGSAQRELIVVDKNGNIDENTPFMFSYDDITSVEVYRIDDTPITISGGKITTLATQVKKSEAAPDSNGNQPSYAARSFVILRSNVTLNGVEHYVENELGGTTSDPKDAIASSGFFSIQTANNVLMKNCVTTGHKRACEGSYDISLSSSTNVTLKNVTQSNYFKADGVTPAVRNNDYWGVMGSNYCKNVTYDSCMLTRFDAHCGIYNGKIINSRVSSIELIGAGDFIIEDTIIDPYFTGTLVLLRDDYGSTWNGTITFKNVTVNNPQSTMTLFSVMKRDLDFGYQRHLPNVVIDNLKFANKLSYAHVFSKTLTSEADPLTFTYTIVAPNHITVLSNPNNYKYYIHSSDFYAGTVLTGVTKVN